jgi:polar amino acid transport system substrate-binding protein
VGSKYYPKFDDDIGLKKDAVSNSVYNFKKLMAGRIDTAVFPESVGIDLIYKMGIQDRVELAEYRFLKEKKVYIGISKKSRLMDRFEGLENTIRSMIEKGEIKRVIVDHYVSRGLPVPAL